jgi:hypothetical protein
MRWYAKLSNGEIEVMTLDELDAAYERGMVDASTLVLAPEATEWAPLGALAGLGDSQPNGSAPPRDAEDLVPEEPALLVRARPKWLAPIVFASVAAAVFVAAIFEARQAGAFSRHPAVAEEAPPPPRAPAAVTTTSSAEVAANANLKPRPTPVAPGTRAKQSSPPAGGGAGPTAGQARVFTSGGSQYDPLNADLP